MSNCSLHGRTERLGDYLPFPSQFQDFLLVSLAVNIKLKALKLRALGQNVPISCLSLRLHCLKGDHAQDLL